MDAEQTRFLREVRLALKDRDYERAITHLRKAVALAHRTGDLGAESRHLGNLALIYYRLGQPGKALESFELALVRARAEGDRLTEDGLLGNMGNVLREMGRHDEAIDHLNNALLIANEIGDVRGRGLWLGNLGLVYDDLKHIPQAIECHRQSVEVARELQDRRGLASRLSNLGNTYIAAGDYLKALDAFHEVVGTYEELGDKQGLAVRLGVIGNIYGELGRVMTDAETANRYLEDAVDYYEQTLDIARELGDPMSQAGLLRGIGNALGNLGRFDEAITHFEAAYHLYTELGLADPARDVYRSIQLATAYRQQHPAGK